MYRALITGVGGYVPEYVLDNKEISTMVDTDDEWIMSRTGIKERRILKEGGTSVLVVKAIEDLLKRTNTKPEEIDLLILCTITPDMVVPCTANIAAQELGLVNAYSFDFQAACSGFVYGLEMVARYAESGKYKKIILAGADKMSYIVDYTDRNTCILFGDGAGAIMVEPSTDMEYGIIDSQCYTEGSGIENLNVRRPGSAFPLTHATIDLNQQYVYQDGKKVFVKAVKGMADVVEEVMLRNQLNSENLHWLAPHQANKRIIDATAERAGLSADKVMLNIQRFGNTTNATIPLCLWEYQNQFKKGDNIICCSFGAGYTWGAVYLKCGF